MKIKELSALTDVHPESIRLYREMEFLEPEKLKNGYYDYSMRDFVSLVYLRKLRNYDFPIENISQFYDTTDADKLIGIIDERYNALEIQIEEIKDKIRFLNLERVHLDLVRQTIHQEVSLIHSIDEKIDLYDFKDAQWLKQMYRKMTPTLFISKEVLNGPCEDRMIPLKVGIGTYRYILEDSHIEIPGGAIVHPNGTYLIQQVAVSDLSSLNLLALKPMMDYAKKNHLVFQSDSTGYLIHVNRTGGHLTCRFMVRACVRTD